MRGLEEYMTDLHLSLDCGDSAEKSPGAKSPSQQGETSHLPREYVTSHSLYLNRQSLKDIPEYVLKCTELKNLYLEGNKMPSLPENMFSCLPNLIWLDLRNNQLTGLPADIGQHRCLKTLLLEGNPITELPVELGTVITLRALSLRRCPVSFPPQDVLQQGLAHILQFLRQRAIAQWPLSVHRTLPVNQPSEDLDMPAVDRLPLAEVLSSSTDLEEEVDDSELQHFEELRQRMIQMERADLGYISSTIQSTHRLRTTGGDRSPKIHPMSTKRTQEVQGLFPELPSSNFQHRKRSKERRLTAMKNPKEKQALLEQRRKDEEVLLEWRNQARIMQERKILEQKQDTRQWQREENSMSVSQNEALNTLQRSRMSPMAHKETENTRVARDRELEQRIRNHVQMIQERRRRPRGPPEAEAQETEKLQLEFAKRRQERDLEYRFTAFTGETFVFYDK
ncbi:leucine-rich repeat-containing protein 27-like [Hoplias malabaricus]|uniref:leucine-rich repeat-containing protein 27-like n=1 Tax=Hoplias malabaricus TaxID=27720 RepID=UPI003461A349